MENVATGGVKIKEFGKLAKDKNLKAIAMNGANIGKDRTSENSKIEEESKDPDEETLCKSNFLKRLRKRQS